MIEGLRSVLFSSQMYAFFFDLVGGAARDRTLVLEYIRLHPDSVEHPPRPCSESRTLS